MVYNGSQKHKENLTIARIKAASTFTICIYCKKKTTTSGIKNHEKNCNLNPQNIKSCLYCGKPVKNKKNDTCSKSCSNRLWPRRESTSYRSRCFKFHEKKCCICDEINIIEVHHLDEDHSNNDPSNLVPLCPTHHQYWHSKFKYMVENKILEYIKEWSGKRDSNSRSLDSKSSGLPDFPTPR